VLVLPRLQRDFEAFGCDFAADEVGAQGPLVGAGEVEGGEAGGEVGWGGVVVKGEADDSAGFGGRFVARADFVGGEVACVGTGRGQMDHCRCGRRCRGAWVVCGG